MQDVDMVNNSDINLLPASREMTRVVALQCHIGTFDVFAMFRAATEAH